MRTIYHVLIRLRDLEPSKFTYLTSVKISYVTFFEHADNYIINWMEKYKIIFSFVHCHAKKGIKYGLFFIIKNV